MKKIYNLQIAFDTETETVEHIQEWVDEIKVCAMLGDIDLANYFDEETLNRIAESYDIGEA
jgi:hypothetical protein